jgi:ubiquinone/menaquinone biosynthesis C-methylase UbiE
MGERRVPRRDEMVAAQYFVAVAGMAAMRKCLTEPSAVRPRLDDVRAIMSRLDEFPNDLVVPVVEYDVDAGYDAWAPRYDGPNPAVEVDEIVVHDIVSRLGGSAGRVALDAACGTGRHSAFLHEQGYDVIAFDANRSMLGIAEAKVPGGDFRLGDLTSLPVEDHAVDLVVCSLALTHVEDLAPVFAEFARVVKDGGRVVVSDIHPTLVTFGGAAVFPTGSDRLELHFVRNLHHALSDYLAAATAASLDVRDMREPPLPEAAIVGNPAYPVVPDAVRGAFAGLPALVVWTFERSAREPASTATGDE